jgi:hypothetical protein
MKNVKQVWIDKYVVFGIKQKYYINQADLNLVYSLTQKKNGN